jgi:hypothetical protein
LLCNMLFDLELGVDGLRFLDVVSPGSSVGSGMWT